MKKLFIPLFLLFIVSQAVIFYLAVAKLSGDSGKYFSGPAAHFIALFITAFLIVFMLKQINFKFPYFFAFLYCVFATVIIEFVQDALPYRTFGVDDMIYGVLGAVTFVILGKMSEGEHKKKVLE